MSLNVGDSKRWKIADLSLSVAWAGEAESMAIDDPKGAFQQQYMRKEEKSPLGLAIFAGKLAFPKAGLPLEIF
jgi:hypothetical protein